MPDPASVLLSHTMTVKTSISLTDSQEACARDLVQRGRYPSLSAVLQQALELLRSETELEAAELAACPGPAYDRAEKENRR